ncbi:MAG: transporter, partial [Mycobacterium sp.]|nr:transporter [Mycobacterium sp.]
SPILNQVVGALFFVPMLLGGFLAGVISDRFERKRLILCVQLVLIPIEFLMFAAVQSGQVTVWMTFPFMFFIGIGGLVNMTAQRPLIYETVGPRLASQAMTIESTAQAGSAMFGTLVGGVLIQQLGMGAGFAGMGVLLVVSAVLLAFVPQPRYAAPRLAAGSVSLRDQVATSATLIRRSRRFVAMLAITVVMNLCMFGYIPLVPILAEGFAQSAVLAGALAAAPGLGQITAGVALSTRELRRHGTLFACGSAIALLGLFVFATVPVLGVAFVALFVSGVGQAGFGSMQSLLAIESAGAHERGVALGVLSTAIGALPIGMATIGLGAELLGPRAALVTSSVLGLVALGVIVLRRRGDLLGPNPQTAAPDPA